jgi:GAF domain-containing protein
MTGTDTSTAEQMAHPGDDGVDHRAFWKVLERLAGTLVHRYELHDVLEALGAQIDEVLGVAGTGVMLEDEQGNLRFVSTSDRVLAELERLQIELDEGPCLFAFRSGAVVVAEDLRTDHRFPRFGPQAEAAGMAAVYSFPMAVDDTVFGALNLYSAQPGSLTGQQIEVGSTLADIATCYLMNARDMERSKRLANELQHALHSRVVIEQAKGYIAATLKVDPEDAFELIRAYSRRHQIKARVVARALVYGDLNPAELGTG